MDIQSACYNNGIQPASEQQASGKDDDGRLKEACADFEAILLTQMLKSMKSTLSGDALLGGGLPQDIYDSMYHQALAENIAHGNNSLGIGEMLYRQLGDND